MRVQVGLLRMLLDYCSAGNRDLHSFPTRRSSDLGGTGVRRRSQWRTEWFRRNWRRHARSRHRPELEDRAGRIVRLGAHPRSEEHTSELQSQSNLVCRLLLEKKKT